MISQTLSSQIYINIDHLAKVSQYSIHLNKYNILLMPLRVLAHMVRHGHSGSLVPPITWHLVTYLHSSMLETKESLPGREVNANCSVFIKYKYLVGRCIVYNESVCGVV